jgi:outer membrane protein TolC
VAEHPVLTELRREFHVPELEEAANRSKRDAAAKMTGEYLKKKLARAERLLGSARTLLEVRRATEADLLAAKNTVDAIKLLLEAEKYNLRDARE